MGIIEVSMTRIFIFAEEVQHDTVHSPSLMAANKIAVWMFSFALFRNLQRALKALTYGTSFA